MVDGWLDLTRLVTSSNKTTNNALAEKLGMCFFGSPGRVFKGLATVVGVC